MSKQSEAKEKQGFRKDAPCCQNCKHFVSKIERIKSRWSSKMFDKESELRCGIGNFKTFKRSWCNQHEFQQ
jgi:hypothetical protein